MQNIWNHVHVFIFSIYIVIYKHKQERPIETIKAQTFIKTKNIMQAAD